MIFSWIFKGFFLHWLSLLDSSKTFLLLVKFKIARLLFLFNARPLGCHGNSVLKINFKILIMIYLAFLLAKTWKQWILLFLTSLFFPGSILKEKYGLRKISACTTGNPSTENKKNLTLSQNPAKNEKKCYDLIIT